MRNLKVKKRIFLKFVCAHIDVFVLKKLSTYQCTYLRLKSNLEEDFAAAAYFSEAHTPPNLLSRGWSRIFVDCETGPITSVKFM